MTTASDEGRRRRFERGIPRHGITPAKTRLLAFVAECTMLTTDQAARIAGITRKAAYNQLRDLYDAGLLERIAVPYASLAPPEADGPGLAYAPGENVHVPTKAGLKYLADAGYVGPEAASRKLPDYGPRNALFLAHELLVRDVRVWLEACSRGHGGRVETWRDGQAAHFPEVRPDAWFVFNLPSGRSLVGMVEADRGTERGDQWVRKPAEYARLLAGPNLAEATGGRRRARLLVVTLGARRRDQVASALAPSAMAKHAFCCTRQDLEVGGFDRPVWRTPLRKELAPLVDPAYLSAAEEDE